MISSSPPCSSITEKFIDLLWTLAGVPVLNLLIRRSSSFKLSVSSVDGFTLSGPLLYEVVPMNISPPRYVPVVIITALASQNPPSFVSTPVTFPFSTQTLVTSACFTSSRGSFSSVCFIYVWYLTLSDCTRSECTAGPFPRFSIRDWIKVASAAIPICPPRASISLTSCPFALPPILGLHGIFAIVSSESTRTTVFIPRRAAASAASHPA